MSRLHKSSLADIRLGISWDFLLRYGTNVKKQAMKSVPAYIKTLFSVSLLCLLLTGCENMDMASMPWGGGFQRIDGGLAADAAPDMPENANRVHCAVAKGAARFGKGWYEFDEARFVLRDAERVNIALKRRKSGDGMLFQGVLDNEGQKMVFCPVRDGPPDQRIICASLYVLPDDLDMGIKRTFDIPDAMRGGAITCAYNKNKLRKL
jgi:hypothetical protein